MRLFLQLGILIKSNVNPLNNFHVYVSLFENSQSIILYKKLPTWLLPPEYWGHMVEIPRSGELSEILRIHLWDISSWTRMWCKCHTGGKIGQVINEICHPPITLCAFKFDNQTPRWSLDRSACPSHYSFPLINLHYIWLCQRTEGELHKGGLVV